MSETEQPSMREVLLQLLEQDADAFSKEQRPKQRSLYTMYFDDGAYKGGWTFKLTHTNVTPLSVLNIFSSIPWPGYQSLVKECEKAIFEILKTKLIAKAESKQTN